MTTLTPADVAADLHKSVETINRYLRAGVIPGFKVGRSYRVDPAEFEDWKKNQAPRPADPTRIAPRSARSQAALNRRRPA